MSTQFAAVTIDPENQIGDIDPRLYGGFIEHLGRAIYGGIYEPSHPTADEHGFRRDVLDLIRDLNCPVVRYPGGNFVSSYNWEDGVGPVEVRPIRLDLAWKSKEPNLIGTNEFANWCQLADTDLMLATNLGTRGVEESMALLEYCNHRSGSYWSDLRVRHGVAEPHNVRLWCLGNEMDGPWQVGQKTAEEYGRLAAETGKAMKLYDPSLELVACGSSNHLLPTYPQWDETVLEFTAPFVDYLSLHNYFVLEDNDLGSFLAQSLVMDQQIETIIAVCDLVQAKLRSDRRINLSFDEWNVWYHARQSDKEMMRRQDWPIAPPLAEEAYTLADALVVGTLLNSLIRHADRVKIACLAQLVNVLAPVMTETGGRAWAQTIYYPFLHASTMGRGSSLSVTIETPRYRSRQFDDVQVLDLSATYEPEHQTVSIFAVNRSQSDELLLDIAWNGPGKVEVTKHLELSSSSPYDTNTADRSDTVTPRVCDICASHREEPTSIRIAPFSWNVLQLAPKAT